MPSKIIDISDDDADSFDSVDENDLPEAVSP